MEFVVILNQTLTFRKSGEEGCYRISCAGPAAEDHSKETLMLQERFRRAQTLPVTKKIHVIPASKIQV
jgi:hypothetical protein